MARNQRNAAAIPRANPIYPTYTPSRPAASSTTDSYDSYEAEKNKAFKYVTPPLPASPFFSNIPFHKKGKERREKRERLMKKKLHRGAAPKGKGMQLGRKSKTTDMFERVKGELGGGGDDNAPLVPNDRSDWLMIYTYLCVCGRGKRKNCFCKSALSLCLNPWKLPQITFPFQQLYIIVRLASFYPSLVSSLPFLPQIYETKGGIFFISSLPLRLIKSFYRCRTHLCFFLLTGGREGWYVQHTWVKSRWVSFIK